MNANAVFWSSIGPVEHDASDSVSRSRNWNMTSHDNC
jgi:hypothetical protein